MIKNVENPSEKYKSKTKSSHKSRKDLTKTFEDASIIEKKSLRPYKSYSSKNSYKRFQIF